jgi:DNA-binding MarR family transcriptional regulator
MGRMVRLDANAGQELPCALASARRTARLLTQMYDSYLSEHGVESAQYALLMMVDAAGTKGQAAMGRALGMDKTTLSRNLSVLRAKGWAESVTGKDARRRNIVLTAKGRELLASARPGWKRAQAELRAGMSEREWTAMWASLRTMTRAVESATEKRSDLKEEKA